MKIKKLKMSKPLYPKRRESDRGPLEVAIDITDKLGAMMKKKLSPRRKPGVYVDSIELVDGVHVIRLKGSIVLETIHEASEELFSKIHIDNVKHIVFDMKKVVKVDSSAIAGLIHLHLSAKVFNTGGVINLVNVPARARKLLAVSKTEKLFNIFNDEEAAIRAASR